MAGLSIFEIIKAKPVDDYEKRITPLLNNLWNRFSFDAIDKAIEAISKGEPFLQPFSDAADKVAMSVRSAVKAQTKAIWIKGVSASLNDRKNVVKKDNTISFNKPNEQAIEALTTGQLAWIGDHGNKSKIAQEISDAYGRLWGEGKIRTEIVKSLKIEFGKYTPEKYAEKFGEDSYWKLFAQHHSVLSSSFASINRFEAGGKYRWWARMTERTCDICGGLHNKVFDASGAIEQKDNYLKAASTGDIEGMKAARPFTTDPKTATNPTVPAHIGCGCEMLREVDMSRYKKGLDLGGNGGKLQVETKTNFGKLGDLIEKPKTAVNYSEIQNYTKIRLAERNIEITDAEKWIENGKALKQSNDEILYISKDGAVVVDKNGIIITAYPSSLYDENMMLILKELFGESK